MNYFVRLCMSLMLAIISILLPANVFAHPDKYTHANEILSALGLEYNQEVYDWLCFISSDMIDKYQPYYSELTATFPGFKCKHRMLFHWTFNGVPWTPGLEKKVLAYTRMIYGPDTYKQQFPIMKQLFLNHLRKEQKRRNGLINRKTESVFGFATGGKDASYANFFASIAYDLHLLGDYTSKDNSDLDGLVEFNTLINGIILSVNRLDYKQGKVLVKAIKKASNTNKNIQQRADDVMDVILGQLPIFIKNAREGHIKRRLEKRGYKFAK